ncbi:hypothetical protein J3R82DRAFT_3499 [Butyriboletus roseoflavus]|nr:hypothetical protein J3R82DRAFT_3499 [Butyriboletus roseoflavus]
MGDILKMYVAICRLTEGNWSRWNLSKELQEILILSKTLRDGRKAWKKDAHRNQN